MDRYGRTQEGVQSDLSPEWTGSGIETGLENAVWQLGLGEGECGYPERPDEADCMYYLRTGVCGYGARCRFNHPRDRVAVLGATRRSGGELPERIGQPVCQYYMRMGTCKFGASCKYDHPKQGSGSVAHVTLNYLGYPLRPGEEECTYYVKTGQCKFGATCKFHHPQPPNLQVQAESPASQGAPVPAAALYPAVQSPSLASSQQYGIMVARPPMLQGSYLQSPYGQMLVSPGIVPYPSWSPYQAPVMPITSPGAQLTIGSGATYGMTQLSSLAPAYTGAYEPTVVGSSGSSQKENPFPERPGQPECQYYMKTGDCKYGSSCRYHHPAQLIASKPDVVLSPIGLPLRPGIPICTHYAQHGQCRFGLACKYDHPMGMLSYGPSTSSLTDMLVSPYPVGSLIGTLAPSSSTGMTALMSMTSGPIGSAALKSGQVPQSITQQHDQSSGTSSGSAEPGISANQ